MKLIPSMRTLCGLLLTAFLLNSAPAQAAQINPAVGNWHGALNAGGVKLRLVFKVTLGLSGQVEGKMDSLDQGARDIPVDSVSLNDKKLRLEVNAVQGVFEGTLDATGSKATGTWSQGGKSLPLVLEKGQGKEAAPEPEKIPAADQPANKLAAQKLAGTWNGTLAAAGAQLRIRVRITKQPDGSATGMMDSLDQGAKDIPVNLLLLKDGKASFEARGIGGKYSGKLEANGAILTGDWEQGGQTLPLKLTRSP